MLPILNEYKKEQIDSLIEVYYNDLNDNEKRSNIKLVITSNIDNFPLPDELDNEKIKAIVFDDVVCDSKFKTIITQYFTRSREYYCSCFYLTQNYNSIQPKIIRDQVSNVVFFKTDGTNFDYLYKDHAQEFMSKPEFRLKCQRYWKEKHAYIFVNKLDEIITNDIFNDSI